MIFRSFKADAGLLNQAFGHVQDLTQGFFYGLAELGHIASHLSLEPANDSALAFDHFAHGLELASMGVPPNLVDKQLAFFGVGLLELDALGLGGFNHLRSGCSQQFTIDMVSHTFILHSGVHDHAGQLFLGNQLERDGQIHGADEQLFHTYLAQSFAKAAQLYRVVQPLMLEIVDPAKPLKPA